MSGADSQEDEAMEEAAALLRAALEKVPEEDRALAAAVAVGTMPPWSSCLESMYGLYEVAREDFGEAMEGGEAGLVLLGVARALLAQRLYRDAVGAAEEAIGYAEEGGSLGIALACRHLQVRAVLLAGSFQEGTELLEASTDPELVERVPQAQRAEVYLARGLQAFLAGEVEKTLQAYGAARALAARSPAPDLGRWQAARAQEGLGHLKLRLGRFAEGARDLAAAARAAEEAGATAELAEIELMEGVARLALGDPDGVGLIQRGTGRLAALPWHNGVTDMLLGLPADLAGSSDGVQRLDLLLDAARERVAAADPTGAAIALCLAAGLALGSEVGAAAELSAQIDALRARSERHEAARSMLDRCRALLSVPRS